MAGNRMAPSSQMSARKTLETNLANAYTGDPGVDSLIKKVAVRNAAFSPGAAGSKVANPFAGIGSFVSKMFGGSKPKGKR